MKPVKVGRLNAVWDGEEYRVLGCLPPEPKLLGAAQRYGDSYPLVTELDERDYEFYGSPKRDQKNHGSCAGQAGVCALDITLRMIGEQPPVLSATMPYALANGGRDEGSSMSMILKILIQVGTCLDSTMPWNKIYKHQIPPKAYEEAKLYRVRQAYLCRSYEELCSAICQGFPVSLGIMVGDNLGELDSEGICPLPRRVLGGHAMCGIGLKKSTRTGEWLIKVQNSWTSRWGINGCAYIRKAHFGHIMDGYAVVYPQELRDPRDAPPVLGKKKKDNNHGRHDPDGSKPS